jgi:hypothetical protein
MQFVKAYWMSLASGVVAVVAIVVAALGMTGDTVIQQMNQRVQSAREITTLQSDPQNQETINAEKELGQKREQDYEAVVKAAESINERKPLLEGAFPEPAQLSTPYTFREAYRKKMLELPRELKAGTLPTDQDLADEAEIQGDLARRKKEQEGDTTETAQPTKPVPTLPGRAVRPGPPPVPPVQPPPRDPGRETRVPGPGQQPPPVANTPPGHGSRSPGAVQLSSADQEQVRRRANIKKARSIRVYAAPDTAFHVSPMAFTEGTPPTPQEMWYAQVGLWVQEDLVKAIARLNDEAAQRVGEKDANVANMPVKRIESIRVLGYVTAEGSLVAFSVGATGARQQSTAEGRQGGPALTSFTGKRSDEQFDVIRVVLTVIVDKRELLKLVDGVTRANFYQLVGAEYTAVEGTDTGDYLYGGAPLVRAELDFEGYMSRRIFKGLMPPAVLQELGIAAAAPQGK